MLFKQADLVPEPLPFMPITCSNSPFWDHLQAIMQSIGGYTTDARGNPIVYDADAPDYYNTHGVLCSRNKKLLEEAVKAAAPSMGAAPA
jgi:hypothetical protein